MTRQRVVILGGGMIGSAIAMVMSWRAKAEVTVARRPGVHAPESVGHEPGLLDRVLGELQDRGVGCRQSVTAEEPAIAVA